MFTEKEALFVLNVCGKIQRYQVIILTCLRGIYDEEIIVKVNESERVLRGLCTLG